MTGWTGAASGSASKPRLGQGRIGTTLLSNASHTAIPCSQSRCPSLSPRVAPRCQEPSSGSKCSPRSPRTQLEIGRDDRNITDSWERWTGITIRKCPSGTIRTSSAFGISYAAWPPLPTCRRLRPCRTARTVRLLGPWQLVVRRLLGRGARWCGCDIREANAFVGEDLWLEELFSVAMQPIPVER